MTRNCERKDKERWGRNVEVKVRRRDEGAEEME